MTRIVLTEFISLDGVIEEPRWTFQFERGPDAALAWAARATQACAAPVEVRPFQEETED